LAWETHKAILGKPKGKSMLVWQQGGYRGRRLQPQKPLGWTGSSSQREEEAEKVRSLWSLQILDIAIHSNQLSLRHFRGRKMNSSLEKAIQEAMAELDRMND
jgi:hypothetical protein